MRPLVQHKRKGPAATAIAPDLGSTYPFEGKAMNGPKPITDDLKYAIDLFVQLKPLMADLRTVSDIAVVLTEGTLENILPEITCGKDIGVDLDAGQIERIIWIVNRVDSLARQVTDEYACALRYRNDFLQVAE